MNDNNKPIKYSIVKSFMQPFWTITDYLKTFIQQGLIFSLIMVIISYIFNQKYACVFNKNFAHTDSCINSTYLYVPYLLVKIGLMAVFVNLWYAVIYKNEVITKDYFKSSWKKFIKTFGFLIAYLVFNLIPLLSVLLLIFRVPNPNWKIELLYFTIVSIGFLFPFLLMRIYSLLALFLEGKNWKEFKKAWNKTKGYSMKIVLSCTLLFFVNMLVMVLTTEVLSDLHGLPIWFYNIYAEILFSLMNYFIVLTVVNFFEVQKKIFLE